MEWGGDGPVKPWCILCVNEDCTAIRLPFTLFSILSSLILWKILHYLFEHSDNICCSFRTQQSLWTPLCIMEKVLLVISRKNPWLFLYWHDDICCSFRMQRSLWEPHPPLFHEQGEDFKRGIGMSSFISENNHIIFRSYSVIFRRSI